ncbi:MFS transporter [Crossiella sp. SN42]|uniref:MFS transporter n=1 Tax=Crossiella sp. SN42 TaxID=2944808 RepID=UPI00207CB5BE|nr:MFS transporter [Crossiella sp. SN42]MCO1575800.1 MFS transporter [Crossiella sp. SN42]
MLYFVNYLDRVNVGVAAVRMNAELGFSSTVFGLGAGLLFVGYTLFELPSNQVLRRVGARRWIAVITLGWGLCATGTAFIQDETGFYLLRFLLGVCEAGFLPGMILYLTEWFPRRERGQVTALFMLAVPVTQAIGTPLSTLLIELAGWRFMLLAEGLPALLLSALVLVLLPDRPETARWLPETEATALRLALAADRAAVAGHGRSSLRAALRDWRVYLIALIGFGISGGLYALTFFLPQIVAGLRGDLSTVQIGLVAAVPSAAAALSMWFYARHSDRSGERIRHIAVPLVPAALALGLALYLDSPVLVMLAITVTTVGAFITLPVWWQLPGAFLTGAAASGGIAVIASLANTSGFLAPYLTGWLRDLTGDYRAGMLVIAGFMLLAAGCTLLLGRDPAFRAVTGSRRSGPTS